MSPPRRRRYTAVIFIGILYTITVWVLVMAFGPDAQAAAQANPGEMFSIAATRFVGSWFSDVVSVLVTTAAIASILSIHNASTRYLFNLGADGALPRYLGTVHPRFGSPARASITISALVLVGTSIFAIDGSDPATLYAQMAGLGNLGIFFLMALVSIAVIAWFRRTSAPRAKLWVTTIAPVISAAALIWLVIFSVSNFDLVVGGQPGENLGLLVVLGASFTAGLVVAAILRSRKPDIYQRLGRQEDADAAEPVRAELR